MHLRPYSDDDLPGLQAALAAWAKAAGDCGYCHPGDLAHRIYAGLPGPRPRAELVQVWEHGGAPVAVAICLRFGSTFDLFVSPSWRGGDAELAMLAAAARRTGGLMAADAGPPQSDVFRCDGVRQALLARLGFAPYRVWDAITERGLDAPLPPPQLPAGFSIRPATLGDAAQLAAARSETFGDPWSPEAYADEVMRRPGYAPERELLAVDPGGAVAAFTVTWLDPLNRVGLFEPVGTRPAFRRLGLARALMLAAMGQMRDLGMAVARVAYDATNQAAHGLYHDLGFRARHQTLGYRRHR